MAADCAGVTIGRRTPEGLIQFLCGKDLFRMFGDASRIRILAALQHSEMCVCDLAQLLGLTVSAVSHQLRLLKTAGLVGYRREGKNVIYALADDHVRTIMECGTEHILE